MALEKLKIKKMMPIQMLNCEVKVAESSMSILDALLERPSKLVSAHEFARETVRLMFEAADHAEELQTDQ